MTTYVRVIIDHAEWRGFCAGDGLLDAIFAPLPADEEWTPL